MKEYARHGGQTWCGLHPKQPHYYVQSVTAKTACLPQRVFDIFLFKISVCICSILEISLHNALKVRSLFFNFHIIYIPQQKCSFGPVESAVNTLNLHIHVCVLIWIKAPRRCRLKKVKTLIRLHLFRQSNLGQHYLIRPISSKTKICYSKVFM